MPLPSLSLEQAIAVSFVAALMLLLLGALLHSLFTKKRYFSSKTVTLTSSALLLAFLALLVALGGLLVREPDEMGLIPLGLLLAAGLLTLAAASGVGVFSWLGYRLRQRRRGSPALKLVGYKQANLTDPASPLPFRGPFSGIAYGPAGEALVEQAGFYSFYGVEEALAHPQKGNVLLEVVCSGRVKHHELGMEATKQRVLQVLVGACDIEDCGAQAIYWRKSLFPEVTDPLVFSCRKHAYRPRRLQEALHPWTPWEELPTLEALLNRYSKTPLVVGTFEATSLGGKWRPTEC